MYAFGINLPVAEIMFVAMILLIVLLVVILVQLRKMSGHVKVLDQTTLEIRKYEDEEAITVKPLGTNADALTAVEKASFTKKYVVSAGRLEKKAAVELSKGADPVAVKTRFAAAGIPEDVATRAVNNAVFMLDRFAAVPRDRAETMAKRMNDAAKGR